MRTRLLTIGVLVGVMLTLCVWAMLWPTPSFAQKATGSTVEEPQSASPQQPETAQTELRRLLADDPQRAADEFANRTSKEAREAVEILSKEAEELRARLQKVNGALRRLQTVLRALETLEEPPTYTPAVPMPVGR